MHIGPDTPAIVTGGASGLGAATARALAARGARVTILDRDRRSGAAVAGEIGGRFQHADISDTASVDRALAAATELHGPARILVNCAGIAPAARCIDRSGSPHDPEVFARVIGINLIGTFLVATRAAAAMAPLGPLTADGERGVIINTASIAAFEGQIGQIAYAASKAGLAGMTLPMARDLAKHGIRVVAIAPGMFMTPMVEGLPTEIQDGLGKQVPFPCRLGHPDEFARLALEIVGNSMLNGTVLRLDGAIRMGPR